MTALKLEGQKIDMLTVIQRDPHNDKDGTVWHCICDCGKKIILPAKYLKSPCRKSCGCHKKPRSPELTLFKTYKRSALKRGLSFDLTFNEFCTLIKQNCFYCGSSPQEYKIEGFSGFLCNGIDRVNNKFNYTVKNTVCCCRYCNAAKMNLTVEEFFTRIKECYEFLKAKGKYRK
jgi:hypothetical protein